MSLKVLTPWFHFDKYEHRREDFTHEQLAYVLLTQNWLKYSKKSTYNIAAWSTASGEGPRFYKPHGRYQLKTAKKVVDNFLRKHGFYLL